MTNGNTVSAYCIFKLYVWYGLCWKLVHENGDFSSHEPCLAVKNHLGTCKGIVKLTHCARHVIVMLKSKLPLLGATSFVCLTDPKCGIKWVFVESLIKEMKWSFPIQEEAFMRSVPFRFIYIQKPLCCYSQLCCSALFYHFLVLIYTILCLLWLMCFLVPPSSWHCRIALHFLGWAWVYP